MDVEPGIVEGFYGKPRTWEESVASVPFRAPHSRCFHLSARKADTFLRRSSATTGQTSLRERYAGVEYGTAREIITWLDRAYRMTDETVQTQ